MLDIPNVFVAKFGLTISLATIMSVMDFGPAKVFFARAPFQILRSVVLSIVVFVVYVQVFATRLTHKRTGNQTMYRIAVSVVLKSYRQITAVYFRRLKARTCERMTKDRCDAFNAAKTGNFVFRVFYTWLPNFIGKLFFCILRKVHEAKSLLCRIGLELSDCATSPVARFVF